jgi:flagellar protein FlaF
MSNEGAVRTYDRVGNNGGAPRQTEGRALLEAARRLAEAQKCPDDTKGLRTAARLNWRLWTIFQAELSAPDCPMPVEIRTNMLNLCNFVDKRTVAILSQPKPQMVDVLINVNRQIAAGLLARPDQQQDDDDGQGQSDPQARQTSDGFSI